MSSLKPFTPNKKPRTEHHTLSDVIEAPNREPIYQTLPKILHVNNDGVSMPYDPKRAPYMAQPVNELQSRVKDAVIFKGSARSGKSCALINGWIAHSIVHDPADMALYHISRDKARMYSQSELTRILHDSPEIAKRLSTRASDTKTHEIYFKNRSLLHVLWPSKNNSASATYKRVAITDYDRLSLDIGGEGNYFLLVAKRIETLLSAGMAVAESSPGFDVKDNNFVLESPHEAPPAPGITALYNAGDRHLYYWQCPKCSFAFAPDFDNLVYDKRADTPQQTASDIYLPCPNCQHKLFHRDKHAMNLAGRWLSQGQTLNEDGSVQGERLASRWASYWQKGVIACDQFWESLVWKYEAAKRTFEKTGSFKDLKTTINVDQGKVFILPRRVSVDVKELIERPRPKLRGLVPEWVRFLTAAVDIQGGKNRHFRVLVQGWGEHLEQQTIDYFSIDQFEGKPIKLNAFIEHWQPLIERVISRRYPLANDKTREMVIQLTAIDSGGEEGVTDKAYQFYRELKAQRLHKQVMLIKGASSFTAPLRKEVFPDNTTRKSKKGQRASAWGDVPLNLINTHLFKDIVFNGLARDEEGPTYWHFPDFLDESFFTELTSEERDASGRWNNPKRAKNEVLDLAVYNQACINKLGADVIHWDKPPEFARAQENNPFVLNTDAPTAPLKKMRRRKRYFG